MYSKHAANLRSNNHHHQPQKPEESQVPAPHLQPPHTQFPAHFHHNPHGDMADTLTGRASHRLIDQRSIPKPYGALGETLPHRLAGGAGAGGPSLNNTNVPPNFHRRSLAESGMLAYTEHAQVVNQRRYQYNFPYGPEVHHNGFTSTNSTFNKPFAGGMGRKWASLPKLHNRIPNRGEEMLVNNSNKATVKRPQSDIVFHEPLSRPNTPQRPASDSKGNESHLSPRMRMQDYRHYADRLNNGTGQSNVLTLTEEDEANAMYQDDFETEDSGVEHELKHIAETPTAESAAMNDLDPPNRGIEIVPFPAVVEFNTQPAVIHFPSKAPKQSRNNQSKQITDNGVWTKKGKTRTVKVTVNNNQNKLLPDYPLTHVANNHQLQKKFDQQQESQYRKWHKQPGYAKQISESVYYDPLASYSASPSPEIDPNEVIVPGIEEEIPVPIPAAKPQLYQTSKYPVVEIMPSKKAPAMQNHLPPIKDQNGAVTMNSSSQPHKEGISSIPMAGRVTPKPVMSTTRQTESTIVSATAKTENMTAKIEATAKIETTTAKKESTTAKKESTTGKADTTTMAKTETTTAKTETTTAKTEAAPTTPSSKMFPQSPVKSDAKARRGSVSTEGVPSTGGSLVSAKPVVGSESTEELADIAVTGSKVVSKPVPKPEPKPKKVVAPPQSAPRKPPTPAIKSKASKPAIRIPTDRGSSTKQTMITEVPNTDETNNQSKDTIKDTTEDTQLQTIDDPRDKTKANKTKDNATKEDLEEEDTLPELRGVLKARGDGTKKGKKKSVQFGPKFVREVTKITYPWNEKQPESDSEEEDYEEEEDDDDSSDIDEMVEEELETMISMQEAKDKANAKDKGNAKDEIDAVGNENKLSHNEQKK